MLKKYILVLLFPMSLFAQDNFSLLDKSSMETSILYDRAYKVANILDHSKKINASYFIQAYSELSKSDYGTHFKNIDALKNASKIGFRDNYIPIAALHTKFDVLKNNVFDDDLVAIDANNKLISNVSSDVSLFETQERTIVSPVSRKVKGFQNTFKILPELITNTTEKSIILIKADFNNGVGFQNINFNEGIAVNYDSEGEKQIDFEITFNDGTTTRNSAFIVIQASSYDLNTLGQGDEGPITSINASIPYQGFGEAMAHIGTGEYKIYYDNVDGILDKPIFFVDGFDPGDGRTIPLTYSLLNFGNPVENLGELVRDLGYDLVILNFPTYTSSSDGTTVIDGGADFIQRNAFILVKLLNTINALKVGSEQNVIIGPSMGGLISRYALRYMEQNAMDHETRLFLSFDSPHLGANVPIGLQYILNYMVNGDPANTAVEPLVDGLLNSAAAKQMLVDHYLGHLANGSSFLQDPSIVLPVGAPNFRAAFQSELDAMGFPQNTRNVSMINGSGLGELTGTPGLSLINHTFDTGVVGGFQTRAIIGVNFTSFASQNIIVSSFVGEFFFGVWMNVFSFSATADSPSFTDGIDSAPGGQYFLGSFDDGSDPLLVEFVANLASDYFNFIPTLSSLAITETNNWYDLPNVSSRFATPFANTYIPDSNEPHVTLTDANVTFALDEITSGALGLTDNSTAFIRLEKNPVTNHFILLNNTLIEKANIEIVDLTGKNVYNIEDLTISNRTRVSINLSPGLYILNITSGNNILNTKLLVK